MSLCVYVNDRKRQDTRATACVTDQIAKRGEQSKATCSEDGRATEPERGERAAVPPSVRLP